MGSELCNGTPEDEFEKINYNPDQEHADEEINKIIRKGDPSEHVAYNINNLPAFMKESSELTRIQDKITKLMAHEKRNNKDIKVSKNASDKNFIPNPYYIRSMDAIYIGEWVLDKNVDQEVPGGLGRLYTDQRIYEGEIISVLNEAEIFFEEGRDIDITQKMVMHSKEKSNFFAVNKVKQTENRYAYDDEEFLRIKIMLHGQGRNFTRTTEERGTFVKGELTGKGYVRIKEGEDVYYYTGEFKNGKKNGKGIEKFKLTSYDGDFQDDQKCGKGTLTLFISKAYDKQRLEEEGKLAIQDKQKEPSAKILKAKRYIGLKVAFEKLLDQELNKYYKWIPPKPPQKSMTENQNFLIEHHRKIKFLEYYKGDFRANQFSGEGTYTWFNGKCYNGNWSHGQMDGNGEFYWPKGVIYRGEYEKDMRHGKGEMIWNLQKRFRGSWAYGLRHGYGQLIEIVDLTTKLLEERQDAEAVQDRNKMTSLDQELANDRTEEAEYKVKNEKRPKEYYLRVKGALFDKDKISKQYFKKFTKILADLKLQQLKTQQKMMIAFVKDIKMDLPGQ